ncbi:DUF6382 domain-containing protein [Sinanaerobacter chloroacetimidivorans]|uniref:DUF6382 domain-containing protein n=1 Tax=Sinanaerobacter chloroacetimidivorans TaxID=2818044 RepID=A0A8J7VZ94_9FIRM|nr:DUF6382 domain-containing protein [Sinanaerobacter chloroacetimidivorans]MBR0596370.1 hypothetical protein [Sinanaerobacter chloroacetimidivorans]
MERHLERDYVNIRSHHFDRENDPETEEPKTTSSGSGEFIAIGNITCKIEEILGKRRFCLEKGQSGLLEFEKKMLMLHSCPYILPVNMLQVDGFDQVYYDFTGYLTVEEYVCRFKNKIPARDKHLYVEDSIKIIANLLRSLKGAELYLLSTDRIPLLTETIFVNLKTREVAFAFIPSLTGQNPFQSRIVGLIENMEALYGEETLGSHFSIMKERIYDSNPGLDGMLRIIGMIQRESGYIEWTNDVFRKDEPVESTEEWKESNSSSIQKKNTEGSRLGKNKSKLILIQVVIFIILSGIYLSGLLDTVDFYGFSAITTGVDLWLVRSIQTADKSEKKDRKKLVFSK